MFKLVHEPVGGLLLRVVFVYFLVLLSMRVMGKREIGKLSVFDLVVSIMIAEVSAVALENPDSPLMRVVLIIVGLALLQILMSYLSLKITWVRRLVDGRATPLIINGKLNEREMRRTRYTLTDLMTQLREKNILSVEDVEFAILETTGKLSVFPKADKRPLTPYDLQISVRNLTVPIPLIVEGKVVTENLKQMNRSLKWLMNELEKQGYSDLKEIFFCSVDHAGKLYIDHYDGKDLKLQEDF